MALPLRRLTRRRATEVAESAYPEFQQRLLTFDDREKKGNDPFVELLAADTLSVARDAQPANLLPNNKLYYMAGAGFACLAVLAWLVAGGPELPRLRGFAALDRAQGRTALRHQGNPGDVAVRRNSDQLVSAQLIGLKPEKVRLFARYKSSAKEGWEPVAMQRTDSSNFQFVFAALPEDVEYYVEAGPRLLAPLQGARGRFALSQANAGDLPLPKWTGCRRSPKTTVAICAPSKAQTRS